MRDDGLIAALHRGRPRTIEDAAELTHLDPAEVRAGVERLRGEGLLAGEGDVIDYVPPADWAARAVSQHAATAGSALDGIASIVGDLQALLGAWSVGASADDLVPTLLRHGPHASEDLWFDLVRRDSGTLMAVLPDVARFLDPPTERAVRFGRALAAKDRVRVIIPAEGVHDPRVIARIEAYQQAGVEYRLLETMPSWFWIDGDYLAVPFERGEARPTSVLGLHHAALAGLVTTCFEELWRQATPFGATDKPWTPLLRLMQQGVTLETASHKLGINPRTGRRRVSAAMEHYGVSTLFALGAAWSAEGGRAASSGPADEEARGAGPSS
ncbi:hypothetical protein [Rathayibacter sp. VKM Ac-2760]|uniref:hypothetical protein n=1 Tax=Rathayibacter sp. VKM Ac-2760 TaxID=2609253 RepID=UPI001316108B|nr:hypothetical protein [Rathayibacter sp. VKM Ac-2760]QHC57856.1 hypothetical protein GSU72_04160 [Rathayibacter sp. VKM Ac-2760]